FAIFSPIQKAAFFSLISIFCFYYIIKKFEDKITIIEKEVKKLDEGDWIIKDMKVKNQLIKKKPTGITKTDIKILQSSNLKKIKIKDGVPFLVSFFLAFIMTLILENNVIAMIALGI
ncbi:MAG: hypothetical protein PHT91_04190, partial [Candidatus Nanoarchaeia archaeon]|nr:hypothetical protein [Candidatus Nanoarchaeia archaeon]